MLASWHKEFISTFKKIHFTYYRQQCLKVEKFEKNNLKRISIALKVIYHLRNYKRAGRGEKEGTFFCKMKAQMQ